MAWMEDILVDEQAMVSDADHSADEELQEACLSFPEAKDHLNKLRIARGFYPVVAALPEQRSSTDRDRGRSSSKGKGKDKGRGRSKGKGRGSSSGSRPPPPPHSSARVKAKPQNRPGIKCFRCSGPHYSYECDKNRPESAKWVAEIGDNDIFEDNEALGAFALMIEEDPGGGTLSRSEISDMDGPTTPSAALRGRAREYLLTPEADFELNDSQVHESDD